MEMFTLENGRKIKLTGSVNIPIRMEPPTRANGSKTSTKVRVKKVGRTTHLTTGLT